MLGLRTMVMATLITGCSHTQEPAPAAAWELGRTVTVRGRITEEPWQHMTIEVAGKVYGLLDLDDGKQQIVVYWAAPPACTGWIEVTGVVIEAKGVTKKPGSDKPYRELQLDVTTMRCVP